MTSTFIYFLTHLIYFLILWEPSGGWEDTKSLYAQEQTEFIINQSYLYWDTDFKISLLKLILISFN